MIRLKFIFEGLTDKIVKRPLCYREEFNIKACAGCGHMRYSKIIRFFFKEYPGCKNIEGGYCNVCGCILSLKIRSKSKCPIGIWMIKN